MVGALSTLNEFPCDAFTLQPRGLSKAGSTSLSVATTSSVDDTFTPPDTKGAGITEEACADAASKMRRVNVPISTDICESGEVGISYINWKPESTKKGALPVLLVHGFDSSCLEYRRLGPKLAELGIDTYAVDLLGWGYSQLNDVKTFSAKAKVEALSAFWDAVGNGKDVCVGGASLGGAAAIEFAAGNPTVKACIFIDAQGFVDGVGPMAQLPKFLAQAGVQVLKSVPLRNSANNMSYYNKETFATEDALKVGRLHCLQEGWDDALVSFMLDGGFYPSEKVAKIESPCLILWGRNDNILEIEFAQKFLDTLPDAQLNWVEECGHVPHLEQPVVTAKEISDFLLSEKFNKAGVVGTSKSDDSSQTLDTNNILVAGSIAGVTLIGTAAAVLIGS